MGISKNRAGHRSKSSTAMSRHPDKPLTLHYVLHHIIGPAMKEQQPQQPKRRRSWTPEQLSDARFLKVPASVWKNIHDLGDTEWMEASEDSLTKTLAAGALLTTPYVGLCKVHKWFWDKSIETTCREDTYRFRVIEEATETTILPKDDWYDPVDDDESKIKILFAGLPFKDHHILLLRRICPDASMEPLQTVEAWQRYLAPSIRQGYGQIKRSTMYGWAPAPVSKRSKKWKGGRRRRRYNAQLPTPPHSSTGEEAFGGCASEEESDY